jgi:hypothetical protein
VAPTFPQQCARLLKTCAHDPLDRLFTSVRADLREHQFAAWPRWRQHELLQEDGAWRYIELNVGDRLQEDGRQRQFLCAQLGLHRAGFGLVTCRLRLELFTLDTDNGRTDVARLEREQDLPWPTVQPALWQCLSNLERQRADLVGQFREQLFAALAP